MVPPVGICVIHPVESLWLHFGPVDQTGMIRGSMEENFQNITKWLLFGSVDFDFIIKRRFFAAFFLFLSFFNFFQKST